MRISDWSSDVCSSDLIVVPDDQIRSSVVVEVGLADNVIITGRMYEVCNVSGRGKADSVVLHGRWFQVELHGGSSICGCRPCDGQHAKKHGGDRKRQRLNSSH